MKRIQKTFLFTVIVLVVSSIIGIYYTVKDSKLSSFSEIPFFEWFTSAATAPIIMILISIIIGVYALSQFFKVLFPPIIKNGKSAKAIITKVWDTGTTLNDDPQIGLNLLVKTEDGKKFKAEAKTIVSRLDAAFVRPGISADVIYNPENTNQVQISKINFSKNFENSVEERLIEIENLHQKGLINFEEYKKKREEIINLI